jgi:HK97 family phage prohead protease
MTKLFPHKELPDFLRGITGKDGKPKQDVALFVPVALSVASASSAASAASAASAETKEKAEAAWVFSTFDLDRFDERIDPLGWELEHYKKNPVVQWAHRFDIPAIGRADNIAFDEKGLKGNIVFNSKEYDFFGWSIGERVRNGILRAGSVGFRVLEVELPSKAGEGLIFRKQELLEFSICNVPANPYALAASEAARSAAEQCTEYSVQSTVEDFWRESVANDVSRWLLKDVRRESLPLSEQLAMSNEQWGGGAAANEQLAMSNEQ